MSRWLLGGLFLLFTVGGVAMVISGSGQGRLVGVSVVLLFGFGGLGYAATKLRRPDGVVELTKVQRDGTPVEALVVPGIRLRSAAIALGAAGMGFGMMLMGLNPAAFTDTGGPEWFVRLVGVAGGCFFLVIASALGIAALTGRSRMVASRAGFEMVTPFGRSVVPWDIIDEVGVYEMSPGGNRQRFAAVNTTDPNRIATSRWWGWLRAANRRMSGWDLTYPETTFALSADELALLISGFVERPSLWSDVRLLPDRTYEVDELMLQLGMVVDEV